MAIAASSPTLFLIAGPNGAGKSTFHETVLAPRVAAPFVNADVIQRDRLRDPTPTAAYEAARIAAETRDAYLAEGRSFVTETVFSHPSKLALVKDARKAGFRVVVFHLGLASAEVAVARVRARRSEGGHGVPEHKVRARYDRCGPLIRQAVSIADRAQVFDSSRLNEKPEMLLDFTNGRVTRQGGELPAWAAALYGGDC